MKALNLLLSSKGFPVKDRTAALIGMKMRGGAGWPITTLTGSLPLTYESRWEHILKNYTLYGSTSGAGVETENLCSFIPPGYSYSDFYAVNTLTGAQSRGNCFLLPSAGTYSFYSDLTLSMYFIKAFTEEGELIGDERFQGQYVGGTNMYFNSAGSYWRVLTAENTMRCTITVSQPTWIFICTNPSAGTEFTAVSGSTAPSTYIPYGYKIPLTNTGENSQSETYPLYIGSSKLGAEEYLDYQEQKIYKRTEQLWTDENKLSDYMLRLSLPQGSDLLSYDGYFVTDYIYLKPGRYTLSHSLASGLNMNYVRANIYDLNHTFKANILSAIQREGSRQYQLVITENCYFRGSVEDGTTTTLYGSIPTDPPVSLPAILTYQGENTLSSTETVGECSVTGRIKETET